MCKRTVIAMLGILVTSAVNIQIAQAVDSRTIIDNESNKVIRGKRNNKIELECIFEGNRVPQRFQGTYKTTSEYIDEGNGNVAAAAMDKNPPPPTNAIFKLRRDLSKQNGKLYVYVKTDTRPTIYQIDETLRAFAVYQQDPTTDQFPFTEIYAGTCSGIF